MLLANINTSVGNTATNLGEGLRDAFYRVVTFVPQFLLFLLILLLGFFIARALGKAVDRLLTKAGFDKAVERGGIREALNQSGYHPSQILGKIAFYTIFLFVLQLAFGVFPPNPISDLLSDFIRYLPNVFVAIVIVVFSASAAAVIRDLVAAMVGGLSYGRLLASSAGGAILVTGVFMALTQLRIAPEIVAGLFYAILAMIVGVVVVAVGGGGIAAMRPRWESALTRLDQELPRAREGMNRPNEGEI